MNSLSGINLVFTTTSSDSGFQILSESLQIVCVKSKGNVSFHPISLGSILVLI